MSMRIDGQVPPNDADAARRAESAKAVDRAPGAGGPRQPGQSDRVEVSSDVRLVEAAVRAAEDSPAIRPEAVARGRKALEDGTLGQDTGRLADRMIDALLSE